MSTILQKTSFLGNFKGSKVTEGRRFGGGRPRHLRNIFFKSHKKQKNILS